jgi:acyl-[acyl-carrier-protein] desaturase
MSNKSRREVMEHLEPFVEESMKTLLRPVEDLWQPSDFLPDFSKESGHDDFVALQEEAKALPDDVLSVLVGDTVTEEALPTYANWLACLEGVSENHRHRCLWSIGWRTVPIAGQ